MNLIWNELAQQLLQHLQRLGQMNRGMNEWTDGWRQSYSPPFFWKGQGTNRAPCGWPITSILDNMGHYMTLSHNEHDGVSNHQRFYCLLNRLFRCRSKETSKLCITGFCEWNSPVTGEFPTQKASKMFPFDDVIMMRNAVLDSKVHGANTGPTWVLSAPDGPHVGPMNLAIRCIYWHLQFRSFNILPEAPAARAACSAISEMLPRIAHKILPLLWKSQFFVNAVARLW